LCLLQLDGKALVNVDRVRSQELARAVNAQPRRCWRNCALALGHLLGAGVYVEGYAVVSGGGFATEHAWLEVDGTIVDPTWDIPGARYYPVARYGLSEVLDLLDASPELPLFTRSYHTRRDMAKAAERAWHSCSLETEAHR